MSSKPNTPNSNTATTTTVSPLFEYPETRFHTFEDGIYAVVNGRRVRISTWDGEGQEEWNLMKVLTHRATAMPALLVAAHRVVEWMDCGCDPSRKSMEELRAAIINAATV